MFTGPDIVTDGLVLALDAANVKSYPGSGTVWRDLSGNLNNGTLTNGPTFDSGNGGSIVFDGANDVVDLPSSNVITGDNLQNMTVEVWQRYSVTDVMYSFSIKQSASVSTLISITCNQNSGQSIGHLGFLVRNNADTAHEWITHNGGYNDNNWHHVCAVVDGTNRILYIDGFQKATSTGGIRAVTGNTSVATVGSFSAGNLPFTGDVSKVKFYRKALTPQEIQQNYNATKSRFNL